MDDDDIREGLRAGDLDRAFRLLAERYRGLVFRVCYAVLPNRAIAEEAMQETFAKAFRKRRRLASADSVKAYLLRIARNTALDVQRKARRRRVALWNVWWNAVASLSAAGGGSTDSRAHSDA